MTLGKKPESKEDAGAIKLSLGPLRAFPPHSFLDLGPSQKNAHKLVNERRASYEGSIASYRKSVSGNGCF
jgi:hypothetical protein